ncbi:MAG: UPF0179 family protein [Thermoplasmata archaeon]|nr:UPF0179 family protein [Candidatus Sysuiplasma jiujiangense]
MPGITLIGEHIAREGGAFIFNGPSPECRDCRLKVACLNLEPGQHYRVVEVRSKHHDDCAIHEGGVRVVRVEEITHRIAVRRKQVVEGSVIVPDRRSCNFVGCPSYRCCFPQGVQKQKFKIIRDLGPVECRIGEELRMIEV